MTLKELKPKKVLNKAFLKVKPNRSDIENFKANLVTLLDRINDAESEEFHKNLVIDFLKKTYYDPNFFVNTKGRNDLVIHNSEKAKSTVGVIIEAKKPTNKAEMLSAENINKKAFQELVLYYLRERITHKNLEIKHLVATNINEWFIFDVVLFERLFAQNKGLVKQFEDFEAGRLADIKTDFFYKQIAEPFIAELKSEIEFTYFNIQDYQKPLRNNDKKDDNTLIALFKLLSPEHLLKVPFANDSNSLDKRFYAELLHIIGLTETKDGGKKLIGRNIEKDRNSGSILEDAIIQLDSLDKLSRLPKASQYGSNTQEKLFSVALELSITWINRILFLKLLEAQLISYHKGDVSYAFLSYERIKNFDDLNSLFFQVLAKKYEDRNSDVKIAFEKVPYLNSSLFEPTEIEQNTLFISNLKDDKTLPILSQTVLKDQQGKKRTGNITTLEYLFEFLNAYDFSSEGSEDIQEDNKTLINASVLGLIFEKINGYKDGSFFTPGFITMYMCRETLRKSVVQKFNELKNWNCTNLEDLYDKIEDRTEANAIVNSIKICDPAVGSGHFLVSALNEMIAIKNDLKILQDRDFKRLKEYQVEVVNDELVVTDEDGGLFEYNPNNKESQRIQETLFHEKQTIIENCLFGVDINPNSVKICRLRLWIELLKNAYYKNPTELETLPNIDINIKNGNSLVSRFALDADLKTALKSSKWTIDSYRIAVSTYRNADSKEQKREMEQLIADIKSDFRSEISLNDPKVKKLRKLSGDLFQMTNQGQLFEMSKKEKSVWNKRVETLTKESKKLEAEIEEIKANKIYENAFEWRFEFPEVLNDDGDFIGFDVVLGNPPYVQLQKMGKESDDLGRMGFETFAKTGDIYSLFYELGYNVLKQSGLLTYITSNKWMRAGYGENTRKFFVEKTNPLVLIDFGGVQIFDSATVDTNILMLSKESNQFKTLACVVKDKALKDLSDYVRQWATLTHFKSSDSWVVLSEIEQRIKNKIEAVGTPLKDWNINIYRGILTGYNEAFIIDGKKKAELIAEDPNSAEIIRPLLRGRDIKRYSHEFADLYMITTFPSLKIDIEEFPAVKAHLLSFGFDRLKQTGDKGARKKTNNKWFETQDSIGYWEDFSKQKIIYPNMTKFLPFVFDDNGLLTNQKCFIITGEKVEFLIAFFNSSLFKYCFKDDFPELQGGTRELSKIFFDKIPVISISNETNMIFRNLILKIQQLQVENQQTIELEKKIDNLLFKLYDLNEEEMKEIGFIEIQ
jgi:adenine-specific DNA-methyltransferase